MKKSFILSLFFLLLLLLPFEKVAADKDFIFGTRGNPENTHFIRLAQERRADTTMGDEGIFEPPPDDDPFEQEKDDLEFRLVTGVMQYKYKEKYKNPSNDIEWRDNIPFYGIGIVSDDSDFLFFDAYIQKSATGKSGEFDYVDFPGQEPVRVDHNTDLSRTDFTANIGYNINDSFLLSLGYKIGQTEISGPRRRITLSPQNEIKDTYLSFEETQFYTRGPTFGMAYGKRFGGNILGFNLSYAKLKTTYYGSNVQDVIPGDTEGLTIGVSWTGQINNRLNYRLSLDGFEYKMKDARSSSTIDKREFSTGLNAIEESIISFKASLNYDLTSLISTLYR